mmetsp:Transcript_12247/g.27114  ORF Transcript_12247/g.27114 Transcript_12247/m.27114 type:complete len:226 (+) Transcript_12247:742-1419(+)
MDGVGIGLRRGQRCLASRDVLGHEMSLGLQNMNLDQQQLVVQLLDLLHDITQQIQGCCVLLVVQVECCQLGLHTLAQKCALLRTAPLNDLTTELLLPLVGVWHLPQHLNDRSHNLGRLGLGQILAERSDVRSQLHQWVHRALLHVQISKAVHSLLPSFHGFFAFLRIDWLGEDCFILSDGARNVPLDHQLLGVFRGLPHFSVEAINLHRFSHGQKGRAAGVAGHE